MCFLKELYIFNYHFILILKQLILKKKEATKHSSEEKKTIKSQKSYTLSI